MAPKRCECVTERCLLSSEVILYVGFVCIIMDSFKMSTYGDLFLEFVVWFLVGMGTCYILLNLCYVVLGSRERARVNRVVTNALRFWYQLCVHQLSHLAYIAGGRFEGFRIQLPVSDNPPREVQEIPENLPVFVPEMSEEEINAIQVSKYRPINLKSKSLSEQGCSSSASPTFLRLTNRVPSVVWEKCLICEDFLNNDDLIHSLPCTHKFHTSCVDPCLKSCPICKVPIMSSLEMDGSFLPNSSDSDDDEDGEGQM